MNDLRFVIASPRFQHGASIPRGEKPLTYCLGSTFTAAYTYGNALLRKDAEYPLFDGQGSERTVTNSSQTTTGTLNLDAFANTAGSTGSSANDYMYAATSGYRNDGDAGLSLVGARYYDSQMGRFITQDTVLRLMLIAATNP